MQWTPDRNAGFSSADPGKLFLPVVQSLVFNYTSVNVEAQLAQSRSLLHWVRNVIHTRKAHPTFGLGTLAVQDTDHESALAFVRSYAGPQNSGAQHIGDQPENLLCVFNFSHNPITVQISLDEHPGARLTDLFGGAEFPRVGDDGTLTLTLGSQAFYWLKIWDPQALIG
jgi:maltose alpha-D-glucosyltransferase/alpha-amylase